jgi:hypothetical protein
VTLTGKKARATETCDTWGPNGELLSRTIRHMDCKAKK